MPSIDNLTPSSSLMLVRDSCDGIQVFMMKRAQKSNFGGIWVFPGGIMAIMLFALNFLGDGIRDALDPRMKM